MHRDDTTDDQSPDDHVSIRTLFQLMDMLHRFLRLINTFLHDSPYPVDYKINDALLDPLDYTERTF